MKEFIIGQVQILLPACYELDSLEPNHFQLLKDDSTKLNIVTDGLVSMDGIRGIENMNGLLYTSTDTIDGYLRQIAYSSDAKKYNFYINIIDIKDTSNKMFENHKYYVKLMGETNIDSKLCKVDVEQLLGAFKECKINPTFPPSS